MKKLLFLIPFFVLSCSNSPESKAKDNVKKFMLSKLDDPKSYESVSFGKIDSVFSPFNESKEGIELQHKEDELSERVMQLSDKIEKTESISELDKIIEENKELSKQRTAISDTILNKSTSYKGNFCGYKIKHSYRAKNKMGALVLDSCIIELDKESNVKFIKSKG